jgi:hypothetical protein
LQFVSARREIAHRKQDAAAELELAKAAVIGGFRDMTRRGGGLDVETLAREFDIDADALKERVTRAAAPEEIYKQNDV